MLYEYDLRSNRGREVDMQTPVELVFDDVESSPAVEQRVRERVRRLERFYDGITSCHVALGTPHRHQRKGRQWSVRIELRVPGTELVVSRQPGDVGAHEDLPVAIRDAFDAMERELKSWRAKVDGEVKTHVPPLQGRIRELDPQRGFGQIATTDGRLVYFHRNSVVEPDFESLQLDDPVEVVVQAKESDLGPQASTVRRIGALQFVPEPRG
jgi:ribosome-associated translation inhibitor RaiA/cold shock CspA family protein